MFLFSGERDIGIAIKAEDLEAEVQQFHHRAGGLIYVSARSGEVTGTPLAKRAAIADLKAFDIVWG